MDQNLKLSTRLDGPAAGSLAGELTALRGGPLTLEAGGVDFIGALSLQVLVAAHRQWKADEQLFRIDAPSDAFLEGCRLLGIPSEEIGLGEDPDAGGETAVEPGTDLAVEVSE
ncbi:STAS domain-containing protein [Aquicoccus sp. SCR17]|nr:STAS domain-containing protein [Carideicomes alvinocaridis]